MYNFDFDPPTNLPVIPPRKSLPPREENPPIAICGECGATIRRVMWFSCSHENCPCFRQARLYV